MPPADVDAADTTAAAARDIRLPPFCPTDALTWFQRVEVQFRLRNLSSESRKADHVLAALPEETFPLISDWLTEQGDGPIQYLDLKDQILRRFVATPEEHARKLMELTGLPLGDQRPSAAFLEMKALTRLPVAAHGGDGKLDLLRVLWLLRLPGDVRSKITNFMKLTEQEIIDLADSLQGAARNAAPRPIASAGADEEPAAAAAFRKPQQQMSPPSKKRSQEAFCFFHKKFGDRARKCQAPCSWPKNA